MDCLFQGGIQGFVMSGLRRTRCDRDRNSFAVIQLKGFEQHMKFLKVLLVSFVVLMMAACGRIDTGHTGVRTSWNKQVQTQVVTPGFYVAVTDDVVQYVTNEITFKMENEKPQTSDKTYLKDLDATYTWQVTSGDLPTLVTRFKNRTFVQGDDRYPMGIYVDAVMQRSLAQAVSEVDALDANQKRSFIESETIRFATEKFKEENLDHDIKINQVIVKNIEVDPKLQDSILRNVTAIKDNQTKDTEIDSARKEALRMAALTANANNPAYISILNAQANMKIAEGIANGRVNTIVVPSDFKGIVNTAK
jgi:regulator of protease activity HflC (stomatin/prohibitin superfamily)